MKKQPRAYDRPKQETPAEILDDLLRIIRNQFCPDMTVKQWCQNQNFFKRVLTYPASWLNKKGVTLPPARYQAIIRDLLLDIKTNRAAATVKHWPGYLLHCFQEHFRHHGETYYDEAKAFRNLTERALFAASRSVVASEGPDPVQVYAQANAILAAPKRRRKGPSGKPARQEEFGL